MKVSDLYETPMLIGDHDFEPTIDGFDLSDIEENHQAYDKIINSKRTLQMEKHNDSQYLYSYGDKIVLLNINRKTVDYYVKLETGKFKITGKYITQVEVWRTEDRPVQNVVQKVFFDHILKSHDTVLSDSLQTSNGRRLWVNIVDYALQRGLNVYVVNLNNGTLTHIPNADIYGDEISKYYSTEKSSSKVRIMISTVEQ